MDSHQHKIRRTPIFKQYSTDTAMNAQEIKQAVNEGKTVHWSSGAYKVERDTRDAEKYLIVCSRNGHTIGLTHRDGVTLNGNESDFFIAPETNQKANTMLLREIEMTIKYKAKRSPIQAKINSSNTAYAAALEIFNADTLEWKEEFIMLCLNTAGALIGYYKVSAGGMTATVALQSAATQVIVMHNHPSGNLQPSRADQELTEKVKNGLNLLDIKLVDHLIVTTNGYYSFADEGKIY